MRYHFIYINMAIIKQTNRKQMLVRIQRNQNLCTLLQLVGM